MSAPVVFGLRGDVYGYAILCDGISVRVSWPMAVASEELRTLREDAERTAERALEMLATTLGYA